MQLIVYEANVPQRFKNIQCCDAFDLWNVEDVQSYVKWIASNSTGKRKTRFNESANQKISGADLRKCLGMVDLRNLFKLNQLDAAALWKIILNVKLKCKDWNVEVTNDQHESDNEEELTEHSEEDDEVDDMEEEEQHIDQKKTKKGRKKKRNDEEKKGEDEEKDCVCKKCKILPALLVNGHDDANKCCGFEVCLTENKQFTEMLEEIGIRFSDKPNNEFFSLFHFHYIFIFIFIFIFIL